MIRIVLVTNTPPPYRVPIFVRLASWPALDFQVIFCARREPNRLWDLPPLEFTHHFLRERFATVSERYIHHNPDILPLLWKLAPDVVITDGFNPTHLYAFLIAKLRSVPHVAMTDGTDLSEQALSLTHRVVRRIVFRHSRAFISASVGGDRLYQSYGVSPEKCFHSWLCVANEAFAPLPQSDIKRFDFIFCGRIEKAKGPLFALGVARETARRLQRRLRILFVGSGSQEPALRAEAMAQADILDVQFHGFASQLALPGLYRSARVFLFPTEADVWGIVANEACAAGLPVIVSPHAGVAGELVREGKNGFIRTLDIEKWTDCAVRLFRDAALYSRYSASSLELVATYNFDSAAAGIVDACRSALGTRTDSKDLSADTQHARSGP